MNPALPKYYLECYYLDIIDREIVGAERQKRGRAR